MEKKICNHCNIEQSIENFAFKNTKKGVRKRKLYYDKNKDEIITDILKRNKEIKKRNYKFIFNYLSTHFCVDCNESNPIVLEFDHRDNTNKTYAVSELINRGSSIKTLQKEIDKCDVRCANCHKIRTAKQFNWYACLNE